MEKLFYIANFGPRCNGPTGLAVLSAEELHPWMMPTTKEAAELGLQALATLPSIITAQVKLVIILQLGNLCPLMKLVTVVQRAEGSLLKVIVEGTIPGPVTLLAVERQEATAAVPAGLLIRITMRQGTMNHSYTSRRIL